MGPSLLIAKCIILAIRTAKWSAGLGRSLADRNLEIEIDYAANIANRVLERLRSKCETIFQQRQKPWYPANEEGRAEVNNFINVSGSFEKIPATFWGVVVGSFFTLTGIYFTNRAADRRLGQQLQSDRELKNREREMTFRKDVYSAAAEAIAEAINAISKLADLTIPLKDIAASYRQHAPLLAKVNLIAGGDTILALAEFGRGLTTAFLHLAQQRMILDILQQEIAAKAASLQEFEKTRDAMLELMRHHNIEGNPDSRRFDEIRKNYEFEAERIASTTQEIQQLAVGLQAKHGLFSKHCVAESIKVNCLLTPLLVAARTELELSINKERYAEILNQAFLNLDKQVDGFVEDVATIAKEQIGRP